MLGPFSLISKLCPLKSYGHISCASLLELLDDDKRDGTQESDRTTATTKRG